MEVEWEVLTGQLNPSLSGHSPQPHREAQGGGVIRGIWALKDDHAGVVARTGGKSRLREQHV